MLYDLTLAIRYTYQTPAVAARTVLRILPLDTLGQRVLSGRVTCSPEPALRSEDVDFFGNRLTVMVYSEPLTAVTFRFEGRVERLPREVLLDLSPPLGLLGAEVAGVASLGPASPHHFLGVSDRVAPGGEIGAFARAVTNAAQTTLEAVEALSRALHGWFEFDSTATDVTTDPVKAFRQRRGVCQDISHVMIAALRSVGVPAGYVSGFLRTEPPEGQPRLEGADAMHAWVRAWCGVETGWVEIDPTNDLRVGLDHVVVAYGRDYTDVAPVKGTLRTAGQHATQHSVDMVPVP